MIKNIVSRIVDEQLVNNKELIVENKKTLELNVIYLKNINDKKNLLKNYLRY